MEGECLSKPTYPKNIVIYARISELHNCMLSTIMKLTNTNQSDAIRDSIKAYYSLLNSISSVIKPNETNTIIIQNPVINLNKDCPSTTELDLETYRTLINIKQTISTLYKEIEELRKQKIIDTSKLKPIQIRLYNLYKEIDSLI